ncbi:hypothetical protein [Vibrio owensii]|uniref:Uncharacterized protein n=1 Tax=Vibrio owensii CAIM 1854 = LMG 25443 TaxID=1229493 RepID=A0A0C1ZAW8_9VIBR|nr:hypothetical protein [Vibrio owensii]KIF53289.1 hypothetical protein H735_10220 [Vibrio owensii CAIM 1854 = LMG 25443]
MLKDFNDDKLYKCKRMVCKPALDSHGSEVPHRCSLQLVDLNNQPYGPDNIFRQFTGVEMGKIYEVQTEMDGDYILSVKPGTFKALTSL